MGLNSQWKALLEVLFPHCFMKNLPTNSNIVTTIQDMSLKIFSYFYCVNSWTDIMKKIITSMEQSFLMNPETMTYYVGLFDEKKYVPDAKKPLQMRRKRATPLTDLEINSFQIGITPLAEKSGGDDLSKSKIASESLIMRAWNTKGVNTRILDFICNEISRFYIPNSTKNNYVIIDGGRCYSLFKNPKLRFQIENQEIQKKINHQNRFSDDFDKILQETFLKDDEGNYIEISYPTSYHRELGMQNQSDVGIQKVRCFDSNKIGESDLKIVNNISKFIKFGNICVNSHDGDTLAILLLNYKDWIDKKNTGELINKIYLDCSVKTKQYIDIDLLWKSLYIYFENNFPSVKNPIETFVILMLMDGCDFNSGFSQIGHSTLWDYFKKIGYQIFYPINTTINLIDTDTEFEIDQFGSCFKPSSLINMDKVFGDPDYNHEIQLMESRLFDFIKYIYFDMIVQKNTKFVNNNIKTDMEIIRKKAELINQNRASEKNKIKILSDDQMFAAFRRIWWTLVYWTNGGKDVYDSNKKNLTRIPNCLQIKDNLSVCGWIKDEFGIINEANVVKMFNG